MTSNVQKDILPKPKMNFITMLKTIINKEVLSIDVLKSVMNNEIKHHWQILEIDSNSIEHMDLESVINYSSLEIDKIILGLKKIQKIDSTIKSLAKDIVKEYKLFKTDISKTRLRILNIENKEILLTEERILLFIDHNEYSISKAISSLKKIPALTSPKTFKDKTIDCIAEAKLHLRQVFVQSQAIIKLKELLSNNNSISFGEDV